MTTDFVPSHAMLPAPVRVDIDTPPRRPVSQETVAAARRAYTLNGRRITLMGRGLFGDPAWDILLDLFLAECTSQLLCVTSVCIGSRSSPATALRYIGLLLGRSLIDRTPDAADKRRTFVTLTDRGWNAMMELLDEQTDQDAKSLSGDHCAAG